jgi:transcriptional regulator with XRE-family HTH domain
MVRIIDPYLCRNQEWTRIFNADTCVRMKRTFRHVLARLRERLGHMTQKELAAYAGTSTWSVQAIELGKLKLSPGLAFRISEATGVDYGWLMENDLSRPPVNRRKEPYSEADLIRAQDKNLKEDGIPEISWKMQLVQAYHYLRLVWEEIVKNPEELPFFISRFKHFVDSEVRKVPELEKNILRDHRFEFVKGVNKLHGHINILMTGPTLLPVDFKSFDVIESDVYEGRKDFEKWQSKLWELAPIAATEEQGSETKSRWKPK